MVDDGALPDPPDDDSRAPHGVQSPHDALVNFVFSQPEHAASELAAVLPADVSARLDWSTLAPLPASFVDERLQRRHADLLFSVRCDGREAFLYLLLEHQSSPDALMPFRVLRYIVRIWDAFLQKHPGAHHLPAVIPVVIHHSSRGWSNPTDLSELFDLEPATLAAVSDFVPRFRFILDDLAVTDDQALRRRSLTAAATASLLLLLRGRNNPDLLADLRRWFDILARVVTAPNGVAALTALLVYAAQVGDVRPEDLQQLVHELGPEAEEAYMTTAQQLTKKVREEALAEGEAKGEAKLVLRQLSLKFGQLPTDVSEQIRRGTAEQLELWADRVLTAQSLEDVLG